MSLPSTTLRKSVLSSTPDSVSPTGFEFENVGCVTAHFNIHLNPLRRIMNFPTLLLLLAATASLVPTSGASNVLRKLASSNGDLSALNQPPVDDSPVVGEMGGTSQDSALSMRLDTSIQGSQQTNLQDRLLQSTTPLTGYLIVTQYGGAACTKLQVASASILNTCKRFSTDAFYKMTATATDYFITEYSDKECTKMISTDTTPYTSGCNNDTMIYVNSNGVPMSSSALVSISRYVMSS